MVDASSGAPSHPRRARAKLPLGLGLLAAALSLQVPTLQFLGVPARAEQHATAWGRHRRGRSRSRSQMRAAMDPPTRIAPPAVTDDVATSRHEWAECIVQYSDASADAQEVWVFKKRDYSEFQRLIGLRLSYQSSGEGANRFGAERREQAMEGTKVTCRDRSIDSELICAECIRVFTGGAYQDKAISVPAFPSQPNVLGCLALSVRTDTGAVPTDPTCPLMQTSFCNTVNARFLARFLTLIQSFSIEHLSTRQYHAVQGVWRDHI